MNDLCACVELCVVIFNYLCYDENEIRFNLGVDFFFNWFKQPKHQGNLFHSCCRKSLPALSALTSAASVESDDECKPPTINVDSIVKIAAIPYTSLSQLVAHESRSCFE